MFFWPNQELFDQEWAGNIYLRNVRHSRLQIGGLYQVVSSCYTRTLSWSGSGVFFGDFPGIYLISTPGIFLGHSRNLPQSMTGFFFLFFGHFLYGGFQHETFKIIVILIVDCTVQATRSDDKTIRLVTVRAISIDCKVQASDDMWQKEATNRDKRTQRCESEELEFEELVKESIMKRTVKEKQSPLPYVNSSQSITLLI